MKIITQAMVEKYLTIKECTHAIREAMISVSKGDTTLPIRQYMPIPNTQGKMALMPGTIVSPACYGIKLVCKYIREPDSPYGTHVGMVIVFDSEAGLPLALIEGSSLTAIRTAAASALATDLLSKENIQTLTILGCGEQARRHITAMLSVRSPKKIYLWGRNFDKASNVTKQIQPKINVPIIPIKYAQQAVEMADLICTTTSSSQPVLEGKWLQSGTHVNLVGAAIASSAEADQDVVTRSRFVIDYRPAAMAAAGELLRAIENGVIDTSHIAAEIGEIASGKIIGRISSNEITVYKSLGVAAQDLAAAHSLYKKSMQLDFGYKINMMDYPAQSL